MGFLTLKLRKQKQLLTILFCIFCFCFSLKVEAQDPETLRRVYEQVLDSYPQNLAEARKQGNRTYEAQILSSAGLAYQYLGEYQKAIEVYQQALQIAKSIRDSATISQILTQMGSTYSKLGDYQGINFLEEQLKQARNSGDSLLISAVLKSLGLAYMSLPNYQKVIATYEEYLPIVRQTKDRLEELQALGLLSTAYGIVGQTQEQIALLEQQLIICQAIGNTGFANYALLSLSRAYELLGDNQKAIAYQEQAVQLAQKSQEPLQEVLALQQLALLYGRRGNREKLISFLQQAIEIAQKSNNEFSLALALDYLSRAYALVGNYSQAIYLQKQSLLIYQTINQQIKVETSLGEVWALQNLGRQQFKAGQLAEAENNLKAALKASNKFLKNQLLPNSKTLGMSSDELNLNIREVTLDIYRTLQQVLVANNRTDEALEVAEVGRARAFVDLLKTNLGVDPQSELTPVSLTLEQIRQIAKAQNSTLVQYSIVYNDNVSGWVKVGKQQPYENTLYIWVIQPTGTVTFRSVNLQPLWQQKDVEIDSSLLTFFVSNARSSILVRGRGVPVSDTQETAPTNGSLANSRRKYQQLQQLHQILIQPIADLLPTDPKQRITFIPQETLFLVPFAALQDTNGKYLIEKHTILTAPSIQVLDLTHQQRQSLRASLTENTQVKSQNSLVVGNPTMPLIQQKYGQLPVPLPSLPGSEKEAKAIASLLNTQALIGNQATENAVVEQMSNARFIHLATHGLLDNLMGFQSSLAFAPDGKNDGFLTAREILNLKLKAELVVLSACDTGRGRISGDGVIGLSRSFIAAGAPSVIVSLWKVPDEPTADLMLSFYHNLRQTPDKAQALRQAMLTTLAKYPNPKDWAAFTLIGEAE
ncbi:CHAT domain-containing tetratricopeptide repeat protein [Kamptonema sp. UHCC 0994]|uniref:CHAT domain-containing tetratricopeptide repeat protein n=1 Tax=Kamptonema sp. UHCC 0994 TaxID=3031329 RepID=UPI0023B90287|nr:CHAT domain-containing tetratricopeptide repeat protein [Kamptonema sp. UHCC 0994]MDF0555039.1 CHAT domain-containing tetratricopeptide repeat protein [Kamptonema sp. UHCC 0994]